MGFPFMQNMVYFTRLNPACTFQPGLDIRPSDSYSDRLPSHISIASEGVN